METEGHLDRVGKEGGSGLFDGCTKCENDPGVPRAAQVEGIACAKAWGPEKVERQKRVEAVRRSVVQEETGQTDPQGLVGHGEELVVFSELGVNSWSGFKNR